MRKTIIIACCILAFLTIYTIAFQLYFGPPTAMPDFRRQLSDQGQRESMGKIVESLEDDNAAKYYIMACLTMAQMSPGAFYEPCCPDTDDEDIPIDIREVEACIATHEPVFMLVREGIDQDHYALPEPEALDLSPHLSQYTRLARLLATKGRLHEKKLEFEEATETYIDILRFAADFYNNSTFGLSIRTINYEHGAYKGLESLLVRLNNTEQCEKLLQELIEIEEQRVPLRHQVELARKYMVGSMRDSLGMSFYFVEPPIDPGPGDYFLDTMRRTGSYLLARLTGWWYIGNTDRFYQDLAEISEEPYPNILRESLKDRVRTGMPTGTLLPALERSFPTLARQEVKRRTYILRVALQLHLLRHGEYPDTIGELSVSLPEQILIDPLSTDHFKYKKTGDGYLLYSFGTDLDDDGGKAGDPCSTRDTDGDLVFEQPEIASDSQPSEEGEL